jgi:hypothetical protein
MSDPYKTHLFRAPTKFFYVSNGAAVSKHFDSQRGLSLTSMPRVGATRRNRNGAVVDPHAIFGRCRNHRSGKYALSGHIEMSPSSSYRHTSEKPWSMLPLANVLWQRQATASIFLGRRALREPIGPNEFSRDKDDLLQLTIFHAISSKH